MRINWLIVSSIFLLLAGSFVYDLWNTKTETEDNPLVAEKFIDGKTVREPMQDAVLKGLGMRCTDCHSNLSPGMSSPHGNIKLKHADYHKCSSCHNMANIKTLKTNTGAIVPFKKSQEVCSSCHGIQTREWRAGVHGKVSGYWDKTKGDKTKVSCVACHDPHAPKFKGLKPAPAPILREGLGTKTKHDVKEALANKFASHS